MVSINHLKEKPLELGDRPWVEWLKVLGLLSGSLLTVGAFVIPFESPWRPVRMGLRVVGMGLAATAMVKIRNIQDTEPYWRYRAVMREDLFLETQARQLQPTEPEPTPISLDNPESYPDYLRKFDVDQFLDEVTGVAVLGNSGSGKTAFAQYVASHAGASQILVLDPHADITAEHYPWGDLHVISDKDEILEQLQLLMEDLDRKDRTPLIVICDEYPSIRLHAKEQKSDIADRFIIRYGSEARKFKKLPIFMSHSGNTKALGLEGMGDFLENFGLVRLQKIATKHLKNHRNQDLYNLSLKIPYSILVNDEYIALHPTHGSYKQVKKYQPPQNLKPLVSLPLTINLAGSSQQHHSNTATSQQHSNTGNNYLERCYSMEFDLDTIPQQHSNTGTDQQQNNPDICPYCDSNNTKWHNQKSLRRYCNDCKKTYTLNE